MTLLSVEHVGKTHRVGPYEKRVLVDVSLAMHPGDFFGVWGAQRSGKTTLLRVAAGLESPDVGTVRFDGVDLAALSKERRDGLRLQNIGLVQGDGPQRRTMSVLDYVSIPLFSRFKPREAKRRALAMLGRLDVMECRDVLWSQLSDSEKMLVGLAHGLVREPRLLLVDYRPGGLDTLQQREIVERLRAVAADDRVAVLLASSNLSAVTEAHAAFTLSDGRVMPVNQPGGEVIELRRGDGQTGS
jgi:putative ABC transport system ATP-binding protein